MKAMHMARRALVILSQLDSMTLTFTGHIDIFFRTHAKLKCQRRHQSALRVAVDGRIRISLSCCVITERSKR